MSNIALVALNPADNAIDVAEVTSVDVVLTTNVSSFTDVALTVDGVTAYHWNGTTSVFSSPAFTGRAVAQASYHAIALVPRRDFDPGALATLVITATRAATAPTSFTKTTTFHVAAREVPLLDPTLLRLRPERPFPNQPTLDVYRRVLKDVLLPRGGAASVQLFHRVYFSQLRALTYFFGLPSTVLDEALRRPAEDLGVLADVDLALTPLYGAWDGAVRELAGLGVPAGDVALMARSVLSDYPQERVAGVAAAVLYAAAVVT